MSQIQQLHSGAYGINTIQHRGNEAIKQLKNSMQFAKDKNIFSIYDKPFENIIESEFINENNRSLSKNKISCLALYSDSFKQALEKTSGLADSKLDQAKYYYISPDQFPISEQIDSYDDKVIYYFFSFLILFVNKIASAVFTYLLYISHKNVIGIHFATHTFH